MELSHGSTPKIVYIGGYSRSGSTLLLRLLAEQPGFVAVGELFDIWERSYMLGQLCGCGQGFRDCDFWINVTLDAFGCPPSEVEAEKLNRMRLLVQGHRRIPMLWCPALRPASYKKRLDDYARTLQRIYRAVNTMTRSDFIVDSSKVPQYAWVLAESQNLEVHLVHLVRDSRATAFSWQRRRLRPEITTSRTYMERHSVVRSAAEWTLFNDLLRSRRKAFASYTLIKYEDLTADPYGTLQKVLDGIGAPATPGVADNDATVINLHASHTASGNPGRFEVGNTAVALDAEWMRSMSFLKRAIVTSMTAAGLLRYGYPVLSRGPGARKPSADHLSAAETSRSALPRSPRGRSLPH